MARGGRRHRDRSAVSKILEQASEVAELARDAFASGDLVTGIASLVLAAELLQVARALEPIGNGFQLTKSR